jgi:hypothetical protein
MQRREFIIGGTVAARAVAMRVNYWPWSGNELAGI